MIDLKQLRAQLKERLDRETVAELLSFIGYTVTRDYYFAIREEKTPSAYINTNGTLMDFGDGWHGDVVALLHEHHQQGLRDATFYIASCLGVQYE